MTQYSIFGAGPAGLYTAWRLVTSGKIKPQDRLTLYEWGDYAFTPENKGTREPAGRICTYHYQKNKKNAYVDLGGMRYIKWDKQDAKGSGHRLVTTLVEMLAVDEVPFNLINEDDRLYYLRGKNFYGDEVHKKPAPYNTAFAKGKPGEAFDYAAQKIIGTSNFTTKQAQYDFFQNGKLDTNFPSSIYQHGNTISNIGYWNVMLDLLGPEGYQYAADALGYSSMVINWNAATAITSYREFRSEVQFYALKNSCSSLMKKLFYVLQKQCFNCHIRFSYYPKHRLHAIYLKNRKIHFALATANDPYKSSQIQSTDYAFLAMPKKSLELVAQATRYNRNATVKDILNAGHVPYYLEAVIQDPLYKIAMFFKTPWWKKSKYSPKLSDERINVYGPTITDIPLRQIYYFGNNGTNTKPAYGLLASYDDARFVNFWRTLEIGNKRRITHLSQDFQPLEGPKRANDFMVNMLRTQLAKVHFGHHATIDQIPCPLETVFMDWGLAPFGGGYHAWAPHYDMCKTMNIIRKPTIAIDGIDANVFIVGSAYSNDQGWVEGAFCTAESVLNDFLDIPPLIDNTHYPFICPCDGV